MSNSVAGHRTRAGAVRYVLLISLALLVSSFIQAPSASAWSALEFEYASYKETQAAFTIWGCDAKTTNTYAQACYNDRDDWFYIWDREDDGQRVAVHWETLNQTRHGLCVFTDGEPWVGGCNKSISDSVDIRIRAGRCNGSVSPCRQVSDFHDWTGWDSTDA